MLREHRGSVLVEYVVVLTLVSLGCALAVHALGPRLVRLYLMERAVILLPLPV